MSVLTEEADDDEALSSIEEKSSGITEESNTALLNEIENASAAGSKGTPADEETKDQPTGQPKSGDDDEPTGQPKDDTSAVIAPRKYSKREIEGLQDDFNRVGNYYLDQINEPDEPDEYSPVKKPRWLTSAMAALLDAIGEDMRTISPKNIRRIYMKRENEIAEFLQRERDAAEPTTGSGFRRRTLRRKSCACGCGK
jgi:hypothetical protein